MTTERVLVVAPHPDDEVLGPGGTIARFASSGADVAVVIMTRGRPPQFSEESTEALRAETKAAHAALGVTSSHFLDLPAAGLDTVPHAEMNSKLAAVFAEVGPTKLFVPFNGDMHTDHQLTFTSALVCARPGRTGAPRAVYAYETLSETFWNAPYLTPDFVPTLFVDITGSIDTKLEAMSCYRSQVQPPPHERSLQAIQALATFRGASVDVAAAEGFVLVRQML